MLISVTLEMTASISEVDDLTRFSVVVNKGLQQKEIGLALSSLGVLESPEHAWIVIDRLRAACGDQDPDWMKSFDAMIAFAESRGWVDETGTRLRAHLEYAQG